MNGNKDWRAIRKARRKKIGILSNIMFVALLIISTANKFSSKISGSQKNGKQPAPYTMSYNSAQNKNTYAGSSVNQNSLNAGRVSQTHNPAPIPQELLRRENAETYPGSYNLAQRKSAYSGSYNLSHGKNYSDSGSMANQNIFNTEAVSQSDNQADMRPKYSQHETILSLNEPYNPG